MSDEVVLCVPLSAGDVVVSAPSVVVCVGVPLSAVDVVVSPPSVVVPVGVPLSAVDVSFVVVPFSAVAVKFRALSWLEANELRLLKKTENREAEDWP